MRAPTRPELRLLAAGLLALALFALVWGARPSERVADRNGALLQAPVATLAPGQTACQPETVPPGARRLRVPTAEGSLVMPVPEVGPDGRLCITSQEPGPVTLIGQPTGEQDRLTLGDATGSGRMRIDYLYGDGPQSLWSRTLGAMPERVAAANGSAWAPWVALLGLLLAAGGMVALVAGRRELLAVALMAFGSAATWSGVTPMFQASDELAHAAYVQVFAELGHPPRDRSNTGEVPDEMACWATVARFQTIRFFQSERPPWRRPGEDPCAGEDRRKDAAQYQAAQPPAYYAMAMAGYEAGDLLNRPLPDRLLLARLVSALLAALTVVFAFVAVREALPRSPWPARAGAVAAGLQPVIMFNHAMINSDALVFTAAAGLAAILARTWRRGLTLRRAVAIGALLGVGALAKITFLLVVPIAVAVQLLVWLRRRELPLLKRAGLLGASWVVALAGPVIYLLVSASVFEPSVQEEASLEATAPADKLRLVSYVWQALLPPLPFMEDALPGARPPGIHAMIEGPATRLGWWDDYGIASPFSTLIVLAAVVLVAFAVFTAARRRAWRLPLAVAVVVSAAYSALLIAALYDPFAFYVQGRYMGVLTPTWALAAGAAVAALRPRRQALATALLAVAMLGWTALALEATLSRWYL